MSISLVNHTGAIGVLALVIALWGASTALADPTGELERGEGNRLETKLQNDAEGPIAEVRLELNPCPDGPSESCEVSEVTIQGVGGSCAPLDGNRIRCEFSPYWAQNAQITIGLLTGTQFPDDGGANLFVCRVFCEGEEAYTGPYPISGPAPADPTSPEEDLTRPEEEPALTYDLFLRRDLFARDSHPTDREGVVWFPLVRNDGRVEVGRIPVPGYPTLDHARHRATDITVVNADSSQRNSLETTLHLRTRAPLTFAWPGPEQAVHIVAWPGFRRNCQGGISDAAGRGADCPVVPIRPGWQYSSFTRANWEWDSPLTEAHHGRTFPLRWDLICRAPTETDCSNNSLSLRFGLAFSANSEVARIGMRRFRGVTTGPATARRTAQASSLHAETIKRSPRRTVKRADQPTRTQIALVRLTKNQRGFTGGAVSAEPPPDQALAAGSHGPRCSWLANRKRNFKRNFAVANNICANPTWVKAKLRKPRKGVQARRWRLRLAKPLRPGRYVLYSRTTTRRGMPEMLFNKKRGNRVEFRVRKRGRR